MSDEIIFIDSNIWLYAMVRDLADPKAKIAYDLTQKLHPLVSFQVVQEVCANLIKKHNFDDSQIELTIIGFERDCITVPMIFELLYNASKFRNRYQLSYWDSLIVSTALAGQATILYSEDMQHGMVIDNRLTIINPFISSP